LLFGDALVRDERAVEQVVVRDLRPRGCEHPDHRDSHRGPHDSRPHGDATDEGDTAAHDEAGQARNRDETETGQEDGGEVDADHEPVHLQVAVAGQQVDDRTDTPRRSSEEQEQAERPHAEHRSSRF
jgi:hypothetical protein